MRRIYIHHVAFSSKLVYLLSFKCAVARRKIFFRVEIVAIYKTLYTCILLDLDESLCHINYCLYYTSQNCMLLLPMCI